MPHKNAPTRITRVLPCTGASERGDWKRQSHHFAAHRTRPSCPSWKPRKKSVRRDVPSGVCCPFDGYVGPVGGTRYSARRRGQQLLFLVHSLLLLVFAFVSTRVGRVGVFFVRRVLPFAFLAFPLPVAATLVIPYSVAVQSNPLSYSLQRESSVNHLHNVNKGRTLDQFVWT